jgi:hypothetical protein
MEPVYSSRQNPYKPYIIIAGITLTAVAIIYGTWPLTPIAVSTFTPTKETVAYAWCSLCVVTILSMALCDSPRGLRRSY